MNKSRIIRSIIAVVFVACLIALLGMCIINSIGTTSNFKLSYKLGYIGMIIISIFAYILLKKKLNLVDYKKSLVYCYRYLYLLMLVLITRFISVMIFKDTVNAEIIAPSLNIGIGSYIVYYLGKITLYPLYAIIIVNTIITFASSVIIKRMVFNITTNETVSAVSAILYIFIPQSMFNTLNYVQYNFNLFFILLGVYLLLKIIDEVKQHKLKTKKYLKLTYIMGICAILDVLFCGRFEFWIIVVIGTLLISNNVGHVRIKDKRDFIEKFNNVNTRKVMYRLNAFSPSKLIVVFGVLLLFMLFSFAWVYILDIEIFEIYRIGSVTEIYSNVINSISDSCNYYIVLLIFVIVLDILGSILKRKKDTKTSLIKLCTIVVLGYTIFTSSIYNMVILDAFLVINLVLNIGNIYYNRDEKIKLLKAEN